MARKPRVEFEGAFYHVIVRGNQRQKIFCDNRDRLTYLERLEHYRDRYGFSLYAYVLMFNHVHLLLETGKVSLSKIMQGIQFTYTQYYNRRHRTVGHLFQGRYKAIVCDRDAYLLELVRYIHLNPGRLRQAQDPWNYRWSSHRAYVGEKMPVRVETHLILEQFSRAAEQARRAYIRYLGEGLGQGHEEKYYQAVDQRFLGDERFVKAVAKQAKGREVEPRGERVVFERLLKAVAEEHDVDADLLLKPGRQRRWVGARAQLVYLAREWCGMKTKELGNRLHRDASMISKLSAWYHENRDHETEAGLVRAISK